VLNRRAKAGHVRTVRRVEAVKKDKLGDVQQAQGDLAAALTSYQASLVIRERLAQSDPGNAGWERIASACVVCLSLGPP
jgi:hypothetical protein